MTSKIEWTETTWNPTTGCDKISAGCKNCYAANMAHRLQAMGRNGYANGFEISLMHDRLDTPRKRKTPTTYFVNSMSDLFHKEIPHHFINQVLDTIRETPHHSYQLLTKRAEIMADYFSEQQVPPNCWLGVSVENRKEGIPRIESLKRINAHTRFLSVEPLLEPLGKLDLDGIDWLIVGGESAKKSLARPMKEEWVEEIYQQCKATNTKFFFKQWGTYGPDGVARDKKRNGRLFRGRTWDEMPKR